MRTGSVVRAWCVGHHAAAAAATAAVTTAVLVVGADALLPMPGSPQRLPLWQLIPPSYAMIAALVTVNELPQTASGPRIRVARLLWVLVVVLATGLCAGVIDLVSTLPPVAPAAMVLVASTFGAAAVVGRSSVWVGASLAVYLATHVQRFAEVANPWQPALAPIPVVVIVFAVLGLVLPALRRT